ncbi:hypothetical protein IW262DRAFT_1536787 [Armillaria fumosa]|nr:hypothetical protein IW262DRAFT_1536787 [Armillaria fumosa]
MLSLPHLLEDSKTYTHLTSSNDCPQDCEQEEIKHLLAAAQDTLKHIQRRPYGENEGLTIGCLERQETDRAALCNFIRRHQSVISAVRRLPPEIISEIFLHTLSWDDWNSYPEIHNTRLGPWSYSCVSRLWRAVALSLPQLWSEFNMNEVRAAECSVCPLSLLQLWLHRSGDAPLRIVGEIMGDAIVPHYVAMVRMIVSQSHRWEGFFWEYVPLRRRPPLTGNGVELAQQESEAPCVQEDVPSEIWDGAEQYPTRRPRLRRLHLGGVININPFRVLQSASSLEGFSLVLGIQSPVLPTVPLIQPNIRRADIGWKGFACIDYLTFPQLQSLIVTSFNCAKVAAFLNRSQCMLQMLHIRDPAPFDGRLTQILEATPRLKSLILQVSSDPFPNRSVTSNHRTIIEKLTVGNGQPVLLPSLTAFSCDIDGGIDLQSLLGMLGSRCTVPVEYQCQPLKTVRLCCKDQERGESYLAGLKHAFLAMRVNHGLDITICKPIPSLMP